jgi:predicted GNAT family acetyltransferase
MRIDRFSAVGEFVAAAGSFLAAREAEHNLMLGISSGLAEDPDAYDGPSYLAVATDNGRVVGAAIRTPPNNLIISEVDDPDVPQLLVDDWRGQPLPGAVGPPETIRTFAEAWVSASGGRWQVVLNERIFRLSRLIPPPPAQGEPRLAVLSDRALLERWLIAFHEEALNEADADRIRQSLELWERGLRRRFWFWEVADRPVSLVGAGGETPNGIRIGPVYTPPGERGRGYASNLTGWVSRTVMDEGRRFCFLYTDLANPTSNKIYQAIGYEPVTDALMVAFDS